MASLRHSFMVVCRSWNIDLDVFRALALCLCVCSVDKYALDLLDKMLMLNPEHVSVGK